MLVTILLLVGAWFLLESGLTFIALLLFLIAVINALGAGKDSGANASHAQGAPPQRPVIVTTSGGEFPHVIKVGLKSHWHGTDTMEDFVTTIGQVGNLFGAVGARILGLKWKMNDKKKH